ASEVGEAADEGRGSVCRRLRPRVVGAVVRERVVLVGPADDGAGVHVGVGAAGVEEALEALLAADVCRVAGHRRQGRRPVVDPLRPPRAEVHHVGHALGVDAQDVVHLLLGESPEGLGGDGEALAGEGVAGDGHVLGVGGEQEAGRGDVLQPDLCIRPPAVYCVVEEGEPGRIRQKKSSACCLNGSSLVSPFTRALCVQDAERVLSQHARSGELVVPAEHVDAVAVPEGAEVAEVRGADVAADGVAVLALVPHGELHHVPRRGEQPPGVRRVGGLEHHAGRGERGRRLAGGVGSRRGRGHRVHGPRRVHVLGPLPAAVVRVRVAHADVERARGLRRRLEQVVRAPPHGGARVVHPRLHLAPVLQHAPRQHRRREGHREAELDVVAAVVVPSRQVHLFDCPVMSTSRQSSQLDALTMFKQTPHTYVCGRAVGEAGVGPPRDGLVGRELAGPLPLEEEYRLAERVGVVGVSVGGDDLAAGDGDDGDDDGDDHKSLRR
ncbi:hypothetical protein U9M48_032656, partial [Paspalum notatum var. saurae]